MTGTDQALPDEFAVGEWHVDGNGLTVSRGQTVHTLEPRAFRVLRHLAENQGKLVTVDELLDAHWSGTVVTPNAVTRIIAGLRKVLDDDAKNPRYIQTLPRSGYRLIAEVKAGAPASRALPLGMIAATVCVLAIMGFVAISLVDNSEPTVAVLPFANLTNDSSLDYIGDGVAEEVIVTLTEGDALHVASPDRSSRFREAGANAADTGKQLGVSFLVDGSVRRSGETLRITARLIDLEQGVAMWSSTEEHGVLDLFAAQDAIASGVVEALRESGVPIAESSRSGTHVPDPEAYDLYLRARHIWHQRGAEPLQPAIDSLREAVSIDPDFARGWGALAFAYVTYPSYSSKGFQTWHLAEDAAKKALELDPGIAEAYGVLATFTYTRHQWAEGERLFLEGLKRNDQSASLNYWYGEFLSIAGKQEQSARRYRHALYLDPTYLSPRLDSAFAHMNFRDFESAAARFNALWNDGYRTGLSWFGNFASSTMLRDSAKAYAWIDRNPGDEAQKALFRRVVAVLVGGQSDESLAAELYEYYASRPDYPDYIWLVGQLGAQEDAVRLVRDRIESDRIVELRPFWVPAPDWAAVAGFTEFLRDIGLLDYWDSNGWGDVCRMDRESLVCDGPGLMPEAIRRIFSEPSEIDTAQD